MSNTFNFEDLQAAIDATHAIDEPIRKMRMAAADPSVPADIREKFIRATEDLKLGFMKAVIYEAVKAYPAVFVKPLSLSVEL